MAKLAEQAKEGDSKLTPVDYLRQPWASECVKGTYNKENNEVRDSVREGE